MTIKKIKFKQFKIFIGVSSFDRKIPFKAKSSPVLKRKIAIYQFIRALRKRNGAFLDEQIQKEKIDFPQSRAWCEVMQKNYLLAKFRFLQARKKSKN